MKIQKKSKKNTQIITVIIDNNKTNAKLNLIQKSRRKIA